MRRPYQRRDLLFRQIAKLAGTNVLVVDGTDANAPETDDLMSDRFAHAADLPVATLVDRDRQQRVLSRRRVDDLE